MKKQLFYRFQAREGYAYEPISEEFYDLFEELLSETHRDGYYGRMNDLIDIVDKIAKYILVNQKTTK